MKSQFDLYQQARVCYLAKTIIAIKTRMQAIWFQQASKTLHRW